MKHENILRRVETEAGVADVSRRDPGLYYTSVFGKPGGGAPWAWRFEGHHLSINVTQLPGQPPVVGPVFIGSNPALVLHRPADRVPVARVRGRSRPGLGDHAAGGAPQDRPPSRILPIRKLSRETIPRCGRSRSKAWRPATWNPGEQQQLRRLIELYTGRLNPDSGKEAWARLERAGFGKVHFGWAGGIESGQKHYYRVHGPTLLIEYDDTQNDANHIHTVYRDLDRDFGGDVLRQHLSAAHQSQQ